MSLSQENCLKCGAQLAVDAQWCSQCLTPVQIQRTPEIVDPRLPTKTQLPPPEFSRWKGGPQSFGPAGRIILTILLAVGIFFGYFLFVGGMETTIGEIPVSGSIGMYVVLALVLGGWALKTIWKSARIK